MTTIELSGPQFEEIRDAVYQLAGLSLFQTFVTIVLMLVICGLIVAGILVSRWYK